LWGSFLASNKSNRKKIVSFVMMFVCADSQSVPFFGFSCCIILRVGSSPGRNCAKISLLTNNRGCGWLCGRGPRSSIRYVLRVCLFVRSFVRERELKRERSNERCSPRAGENSGPIQPLYYCTCGVVWFGVLCQTTLTPSLTHFCSKK
jgi:hypothetical protein